MKRLIIAGMVLFSILAADARADLTGRWSCNDGGTYYLRQIGESLHWYGESARAQPAWSNVFSGRIHQGRIQGNWADVPKGRSGESGDLELVIQAGGHRLQAVGQSGGFAGSRWDRLAADTSASRPLKPLKPSGNQDCVGFNPATVSLRQVNGRWKIVDHNHWLFDFGSNQAAANRALTVIRHYRLDRSCAIGRPDPSFTYMLAKGGSPAGAMTGEDCVAFDPQRVTTSRIEGRWKIVSGSRWLFDFGRNETLARQALAVIRQHGFTRSCFVGRPKPGLTYLRR